MIQMEYICSVQLVEYYREIPENSATIEGNMDKSWKTDKQKEATQKWVHRILFVKRSKPGKTNLMS